VLGEDGGFDHPALLYRDADEYVAGTVAFVEAGLAPVSRSWWPCPRPTST